MCGIYHLIDEMSGGMGLSEEQETASECMVGRRVGSSGRSSLRWLVIFLGTVI